MLERNGIIIMDKEIAMSVILITGSNSGIGLATALHLGSKGHRIYASMRNLERGDNLRDRAGAAGLDIKVCQADVNDETSIKDCVNNIIENDGRIDVLVNNAGIGPLGTIEEMDDAASKAIFETNFFGALRAIRAVLPSMRGQQSGVIVNISSVAGRVASNCMGIYSASKFALEAASESLAQELVPFGVRVAIVEPGFISTPILDAALQSVAEETSYPAATERIKALFMHGKQVGESPERVAETIEFAINDTGNALRYPVGDGARAFVEGRTRMTDEYWVAMGRHKTVEDYFQEFAERFPPPT
ncbi:oxidoreductase [soil metagenome]